MKVAFVFWPGQVHLLLAIALVMLVIKLVFGWRMAIDEGRASHLINEVPVWVRSSSFVPDAISAKPSVKEEFPLRFAAGPGAFQGAEYFRAQS
jgi:hypothetical protein